MYSKFILPISSVLSVLPVVSSASWESHCISTHYNDVKMSLIALIGDKWIFLSLLRNYIWWASYAIPNPFTIMETDLMLQYFLLNYLEGNQSLRLDFVTLTSSSYAT